MNSSLFRRLFITMVGIFLLLLLAQWTVVNFFFEDIYLQSIMASHQTELLSAASRYAGGDEASSSLSLQQHAADTNSYIMVLRSDYSFGDSQFMDRMGSVSLHINGKRAHVLTASFSDYPVQPIFYQGSDVHIIAMQLGNSSYYEPLILTTDGRSYTNLNSVHNYKNSPSGHGDILREIHGIGTVTPLQTSALSTVRNRDVNFLLYQAMLPCLLYRLPIETTLDELTGHPIVTEDGISYAIYTEKRVVDGQTYYCITARQIVVTGEERLYFNRMFYIVYFVLGIVMIAAAWMLSRSLSKPLVLLSDAAQHLSQLDFSHKVSVHRDDELGFLSDAINHMADALADALSELRVQNEQSRSNELRMQKLMTDLAHEFKTPLFIISSYAEALESGIAADNTKKYYSFISDEVNRLSDLVNEVIELSHIQMGTWRVKIEPWDIYDVIQMIIEKFEERFSSGGYHVSWAADEAAVLMDPRRIEQVLTNLLSNALKYTSDEKRIDVFTRLSQDHVTVWVCNSGELSDHDRERIWERYYRRDSSQLSLLPSDGIGLDIVKTILNAHGSQYGVTQSDGMVRFYFTLPLSGDP